MQEVDFVSDDAALAGTVTMTCAVGAAAGQTRGEIVAEDVPDGISAGDTRPGRPPIEDARRAARPVGGVAPSS